MTNVIYMLSYPCVMAYVGQTKRTLKLCIAEQKTVIQHMEDSYALACHYMKANHASAATLYFRAIEHVKTYARGGHIIARFKQREAFWIYTLDNTAPRGPNHKHSLASLYLLYTGYIFPCIYGITVIYGPYRITLILLECLLNSIQYNITKTCRGSL